MLGSMLAGTDESPGDVLEVPEMIGGRQQYLKYKAYRGMASVEAQIDWRGHTASVEGVTSRVPYKGEISHVLSSIENGIRSGLSYSGAIDVKHFKTKAKFIKQSNAGLQESRTHVHNL
jgi:IMP dehydrogenase